MILDLRSVFSNKVSKLPVEYSLDLSDYEQNSVYPIKLVDFKGYAENNADVVTLNGEAVFDYYAPCDRCLEPTIKQMKVKISHIIVSELSNDDQEEFIVADKLRINLEELLRTDVILALPYIYLCNDDCKGICSGCGKFLNKEDCVCEKEIDPRFEKLSKFYE